MHIAEYILIAFALAMDAFAVSIGKGLSVKCVKPRHLLCVALWFGGFQALMPAVGYLLGSSFASLIEQIDHWVAFALLVIIGVNMARESFHDEEDCDVASQADFSVRKMLLLAIATSIDALAVGVSFAFLTADIIVAITIIGVITAILSAIGLKIGFHFGCKHRSKAELAGGIVLIVLGTKILVEHTVL